MLFGGTTYHEFYYICIRNRALSAVVWYWFCRLPMNKERCRSGRTGRTRNAVNGQLFRGFESLSLRQ